MIQNVLNTYFWLAFVLLTSVSTTSHAQHHTSAIPRSAQSSHESHQSCEFVLGSGVDVPLKDEGVRGLISGELVWRVSLIPVIAMVSQLDYSYSPQHEEAYDVRLAGLVRYTFLRTTKTKRRPVATEVFVDVGGGYLFREKLGVLALGGGLQLFPAHDWGFGGRVGASIDQHGTFISTEIFTAVTFL